MALRRKRPRENKKQSIAPSVPFFFGPFGKLIDLISTST